MNTKKIVYIFIFAIIISLGLYTTVSAASYVSLLGLFSAKNLRLQKWETIGPHGCPIRLGDSLETCDIDPGDYMTANGTLQWGAGFPSPLPAMGMGAGSLGYIPESYNGIYCSAGSSDFGTGPGNSTQDGKICEITFNNPNPGTGNAWYNVYAEAGATRGSKYLMGLASNGGSNTMQVDFYVRVKPLACVINSFSCSAGTLSWDTSSICTSRNITGVGSVGVSGSTNVPAGSYELTVSNGETGDFSSTVCTAPSTATLNAYWAETGTTNLTKTVNIGQTYSIPFRYVKIGTGKLFFTGCYIAGTNNETRLVDCHLTPGTEIPN